MKHYTVEQSGKWGLDYEVKVFDENGAEVFSAKVDSFNIEGFCQCLAEFGYMYFINGVNHTQFV